MGMGVCVRACCAQVEQVVDDNWGRLSSFVQLRASIPVFWSQIGNIATPKPPILLGPVDPTFKAAQYVVAVHSLYQSHCGRQPLSVDGGLVLCSAVPLSSLCPSFPLVL